MTFIDKSVKFIDIVLNERMITFISNFRRGKTNS